MNRLTIGPRHIEIIDSDDEWTSHTLSEITPQDGVIHEWLKDHYAGYERLRQRIVADFVKAHASLEEAHDWVKHEELWNKEMFKRYAQFSEAVPELNGASDWRMHITCYPRESSRPIVFGGRGETIGQAIQNARNQCLSTV